MGGERESLFVCLLVFKARLWRSFQPSEQKWDSGSSITNFSTITEMAWGLKPLVSSLAPRKEHTGPVGMSVSDAAEPTEGEALGLAQTEPWKCRELHTSCNSLLCSWTAPTGEAIALTGSSLHLQSLFSREMWFLAQAVHTNTDPTVRALLLPGLQKTLSAAGTEGWHLLSAGKFYFTVPYPKPDFKHQLKTTMLCSSACPCSAAPLYHLHFMRSRVSF